MIKELIKRKNLFLFLVLFLPFFYAKGQINEGIYLIDNNEKECSIPDSAKKKIEIRKVLKGTYIISYSSKYNNKWHLEQYYDELRADYLDYTYKKQYKEFKYGFSDTIYFWTRNYTTCCGSANYRDKRNTKTICTQRKDSLYKVVILNYEDTIIQKGKSKYIYPLIWLDTVSFYQDDKLFKQIDNSTKDRETRYFDKRGKRIEPIICIDKQIVEPNFPNSNKSFKKNLDEYFRKLIYLEYPQEANDNFIDGDIYIRFIITKKGNIECVEDLRRVPILSDICIERVKTLPKLEPAKQNGKTINVSYVYKFSFHID